MLSHHLLLLFLLAVLAVVLVLVQCEVVLHSITGAVAAAKEVKFCRAWSRVGGGERVTIDPRKPNCGGVSTKRHRARIGSRWCNAIPLSKLLHFCAVE